MSLLDHPESGIHLRRRSVLWLPIAVACSAVLAHAVGLREEPPPAGAQDQPGRRAHHALAWDPEVARVILYGGSTPLEEGNSFELYDDVWALEGSQWTLVGRTGRRSSGQRLASDARGTVLSFGGWDGDPLAGLFRVEGAKLVELAALERPTTEGGFVYDSARNRWVLFGGYRGSGKSYGDTWEFDGASWARVATSGPEARKSFAMAYDERSTCTVVFGGSGTSQRLGDTWTFDGTAWAPVATSGPSPCPRASPGCAYDAARGVVLVFGGLGEHGMLGDTWGWDGTRWTLLSETGPEPRAMGMMAWDAAARRVVLFGGRSGLPDGDRADTWAWDGRNWTKLAG